MANAQNNKSANAFQDDFGTLFDGIDMEDFSENLIDDSDEFDRLLSDKIAAKSADHDVTPKSGVKKVTEMERLGPKLVKNNQADKKRDIDALLDSLEDDEPEIDLGRDFAFKAVDNDAKADSRTGGLGRGLVDQLDDFEAFDEFGEIDSLSDAKLAGFSPATKAVGAENPESMVDLEEAFGVKFKPDPSNAGNDFSAFDDLGFDDKENASLPKREAYGTDYIVDKSDALVAGGIKDKAAVKESPVVQLTTVSNPTQKPSASLDYELLDDDFEESSGTNPVEQPVLSGKIEDELDEAVTGFEVDDFVPVNFDHASTFAETAPMFDSTTPSSQNSGFNEIDDFGDDIPVSVSVSAAPVAEIKPEVKPVDKVVVVTEPANSPALEQKINELWAAHNLVKQEVDVLIQQKPQTPEVDKMEGLDRQSRERRDRKYVQDLVNAKTKKISMLAYMAAGASVFSLLVGGGILFSGWGSMSEIKALKEQTATIDQNLAAIKARGVNAGEGHQDNTALTQLAEQVKKIQMLLTGDKAAVMHGLHSSVSEDKNAVGSHNTKALQDIQSKTDSSIRVVAEVDKGGSGSKKSASPSAWVTNLVSVRQDWYAKQKAAEFANQGVPTVIVPVNVNGQTVYILRSNSFATQEQAMAYANKAKKVLNLSTILVTPSE